jgi:hypothetical protein
LYVLTAGTDGSFIQLFPNEMARNNRIKAGQTLKQPDGTGTRPRAGRRRRQFHRDRVQAPRDFSAAGMKMEGASASSRRSTREVANRHTGPGSAFAGKPVCDAGAACDAIRRCAVLVA